MDVVSEVLPGKTHLVKSWAVAEAVVIQPVLDKIQRAGVCPQVCSLVKLCVHGPGTGALRVVAGYLHAHIPAVAPWLSTLGALPARLLRVGGSSPHFLAEVFV